MPETSTMRCGGRASRAHASCRARRTAKSPHPGHHIAFCPAKSLNVSAVAIAGPPGSAPLPISGGGAGRGTGTCPARTPVGAPISARPPLRSEDRVGWERRAGPTPTPLAGAGVVRRAPPHLGSQTIDAAVPADDLAEAAFHLARREREPIVLAHPGDLAVPADLREDERRELTGRVVLDDRDAPGPRHLGPDLVRRKRPQAPDLQEARAHAVPGQPRERLPYGAARRAEGDDQEVAVSLDAGPADVRPHRARLAQALVHHRPPDGRVLHVDHAPVVVRVAAA